MKDNVIVDYDKVQDALQYFQEFRMEELNLLCLLLEGASRDYQVFYIFIRFLNSLF